MLYIGPVQLAVDCFVLDHATLQVNSISWSCFV